MSWDRPEMLLNAERTEIHAPIVKVFAELTQDFEAFICRHLNLKPPRLWFEFDFDCHAKHSQLAWSPPSHCATEGPEGIG